MVHMRYAIKLSDPSTNPKKRYIGIRGNMTDFEHARLYRQLCDAEKAIPYGFELVHVIVEMK